MTEPRRGGTLERVALALILVLALALRLVAVAQYEAGHPNAEHPAIDEASYDAWAREIAGGDWIGKGVFFQEPLYPYTLGALYALVGPDRLAARIAQCVLWVLAAFVVWRLTRRLFGRAAGWIATLAIALHAPGLLYPAFLLKENLFLPVLALLAFALVRTRDRPTAARWLVVGVLAGLGALLRGNVLVLLPLLALWPLGRAWKRRVTFGAAVRSGATVLGGAALVLVPVAARNLAVGGEFLLTTSGAGTNLYGGNCLENPYGRATEFSFVRGIPEHEAEDWRREAERRTGRSLDAGEVSSFWRGELLRSVREHPREHLAILWNKLRLSLGKYEVHDVHCLAWDARYVPIARAPWPGFGFVGAFGLAGLVLFALHVRWGRRTSLVTPLPGTFDIADAGAAAEVGVLFLLYLGTIVLTVTSGRARLPLVPLLAPFAAWTVVWGIRAARTRNQDALVRLALALFLGAVAVHTSVLPDAEREQDLAERDHNLAVLLLREGRGDEARGIAERLVREHPRSARSRILLAEIELRAGEDPGEVLAGVEPLADEASLLPRERFRARSLVAWLRLRRGDLAEAERRFREALAFDGDDRSLREGLVRSLVGRGDGAEALALARGLSETLPAGEDPAPLELLLAQAEFARGRAVLDARLGDDAERELGRSLVQGALDRLRPLAASTDVARAVRRDARMVAGGIQLYRGNLEPAENHFRAALELAGGPEEERALLERIAAQLTDDPQAEDLLRRLEGVTLPPPSPPR